MAGRVRLLSDGVVGLCCGHLSWQGALERGGRRRVRMGWNDVHGLTAAGVGMGLHLRVGQRRRVSVHDRLLLLLLLLGGVGHASC